MKSLASNLTTVFARENGSVSESMTWDSQVHIKTIEILHYHSNGPFMVSEQYVSTNSSFISQGVCLLGQPLTYRLLTSRSPQELHFLIRQCFASQSPGNGPLAWSPLAFWKMTAVCLSLDAIEPQKCFLTKTICQALCDSTALQNTYSSSHLTNQVTLPMILELGSSDLALGLWLKPQTSLCFICITRILIFVSYRNATCLKLFIRKRELIASHAKASRPQPQSSPVSQTSQFQEHGASERVWGLESGNNWQQQDQLPHLLGSLQNENVEPFV